MGFLVLQMSYICIYKGLGKTLNMEFFNYLYMVKDITKLKKISKLKKLTKLKSIKELGECKDGKKINDN